MKFLILFLISLPRFSFSYEFKLPIDSVAEFDVTRVTIKVSEQRKEFDTLSYTIAHRALKRDSIEEPFEWLEKNPVYSGNSAASDMLKKHYLKQKGEKPVIYFRKAIGEIGIRNFDEIKRDTEQIISQTISTMKKSGLAGPALEDVTQTLKAVFLDENTLKEKNLKNVKLIYGTHGLKLDSSGLLNYEMNFTWPLTDSDLSLKGQYQLDTIRNEVVWTQFPDEKELRSIFESLTKKLMGNEQQATLYLSNISMAASDSAVFRFSKDRSRVNEVWHVRRVGNEVSGKTDITTIKRRFK